jgi:NDP-sugar pyrophosphorylase family protein
MKVIIPMAGTGNRFVQKGYMNPKPLIRAGSMRIIEHIYDMFDAEKDSFIFICNQDHIDNTNMKKFILSMCPKATIICMDNHKDGPVRTVQAAFDLIDDDEEIIISYCDNPLRWDYADFKGFVSESNIDGCILTHTGFHPHTLSDTKMAFLKVDDSGLLEEIKEKECYTDNPMEEHASTGVYYFKRGSDVKKYFLEALNKNLTYNNEYYVTLVYNLLVEDGLKIGYYDTEFVTVFGTPEELENFEAWNTIIKGSQVKSEEDLIACYRYWRAFSNE